LRGALRHPRLEGFVEAPDLLFGLLALGDVSDIKHYPPHARIVQQVVGVKLKMAPGTIFVAVTKIRVH